MRAFFCFIFAFLIQNIQASSNANLVVVKIIQNDKTGLRSSCAPADAEAIDMFLAFHLKVAGVQQVDSDDSHIIACENQTCHGLVPWKDETGSIDQEHLAEFQREVKETCTSLLLDLSVDTIFTPSCRNLLKGSACQVDLTLSTM